MDDSKAETPGNYTYVTTTQRPSLLFAQDSDAVEAEGGSLQNSNRYEQVNDRRSVDVPDIMLHMGATYDNASEPLTVVSLLPDDIKRITPTYSSLESSASQLNSQGRDSVAISEHSDQQHPKHQLASIPSYENSDETGIHNTDNAQEGQEAGNTSQDGEKSPRKGHNSLELSYENSGLDLSRTSTVKKTSTSDADDSGLELSYENSDLEYSVKRNTSLGSGNGGGRKQLEVVPEDIQRDQPEETQSTGREEAPGDDLKVSKEANSSHKQQLQRQENVDISE